MKKKSKGFLVSDALVCVFIVSIISTIVCVCVITHSNMQESIHNQCELMEEDMIDFFNNQESCIVCTPETTEEVY